MSRFVQVDRETAYLLPPSVPEWLPKDHLSLSDLKFRQAAKCKTARRIATEQSQEACFGHQNALKHRWIQAFRIQPCRLPAGGFA
ncbi:MAG: hypothetical protein HYY78_06820 [Betaproteobacteria bacterium]|nr:hypothetical protein [Betaproteobacteria bacterium]